jgi:hypothetical protein
VSLGERHFQYQTLLQGISIEARSAESVERELKRGVAPLLFIIPFATGEGD